MADDLALLVEPVRRSNLSMCRTTELKVDE
jgi:hypothetical protein